MKSYRHPEFGQLTKIGMGVCTLAYPELRLSHCPSIRISNAVGPCQGFVFINTLHYDLHENHICNRYQDTTPHYGRYSIAETSYRCSSNLRDLSPEASVK